MILGEETGETLINFLEVLEGQFWKDHRMLFVHTCLSCPGSLLIGFVETKGRQDIDVELLKSTGELPQNQ